MHDSCEELQQIQTMGLFHFAKQKLISSKTCFRFANRMHKTTEPETGFGFTKPNRPHVCQLHFISVYIQHKCAIHLNLPFFLTHQTDRFDSQQFLATARSLFCQNVAVQMHIAILLTRFYVSYRPHNNQPVLMFQRVGVLLQMSAPLKNCSGGGYGKDCNIYLQKSKFSFIYYKNLLFGTTVSKLRRGKPCTLRDCYRRTGWFVNTKRPSFTI